MKLHQPEIYVMDEGEARLRTISERLWSHSNQSIAGKLQHLTETIATGYWQGDANAVKRCEALLDYHEIAPASAIAHIVGYNQY